MNRKERERLSILETNLANIGKKVEEMGIDLKKIMTNELPHLRILVNEKITKLKESINGEFKVVDERFDKSEKKLLILWTILLIIATIIQIIFTQVIAKFLKWKF